MNRYPYQFDAEVVLLDFGRMAYAVVYLPPKARAELPLDENPRLRVDGEINGTPFQGACQPAARGRRYLLLSKKFLKLSRLAVGDKTHVEFRIADQNAVEVPPELQFALEANRVAAAVWDRITAGKRRGLAYRVSSAKRAATRENRVEEVIDELCQMSEA